MLTPAQFASLVLRERDVWSEYDTAHAQITRLVEERDTEVMEIAAGSMCSCGHRELQHWDNRAMCIGCGGMCMPREEEEK